MTKLIDKNGRNIDYLRVSVTDRCNLRCCYCMPATGVAEKTHADILRYEEIIKIVRAGVKLGIDKIRITGGEPLVREGIVDFFRMLSAIEGLRDISMTTNGILLEKYAAELKAAGLERVNISLDSLQPEKYAEITRRDQFNRAIAGIKTALTAGLKPVKINTVVMKGINDNEISDFVRLSINQPLHVRFIEFMPLGEMDSLQSDRYLSLQEVKNIIEGEFELNSAGIKSNGPAQYYKCPSGRGTVGFITPISHNFCSKCNRLRLTADGRLRPCLASEAEIDLHNEHGEIGTIDDLISGFKQAIISKPGSHNYFKGYMSGRAGENNLHGRNMSQIGG